MNTEKLDSIKSKFEELTRLISDPAVIADNKEWTKLVKEHSSLQPVADAYSRLLAAEKELESLKEMLESEEDRELRELASEELEAKLAEKEAIESELKILLLPVDPNDDKNVIIEIRAGAGRRRGGFVCGRAYAHV